MADPTQTTGTPALNPPPPGEGYPGAVADTPQGIDNYDVVIGGVGYMLFRDPDDSAPDRTYKTEPSDLTYSPIFVDRSNQSGNLGDSQQDFFMTFKQNDWSGGIGQKYFRNQTDKDRSFWDGRNVQPSVIPGAVSMGPAEQSSNLSGGAGVQLGMNMMYFKDTGTTTTTTGDCLVKVEVNSGATCALYFSIDGGVTWTLQPTSNNANWNDCTDSCQGDNGQMYWLESTRGATSTIHSIKGINMGMGGAASTTIAWVNSISPNSVTMNCIEFYSGALYVGDDSGRLVGCSGVASATFVTTIIKDFGAGKIIDLVSGGGYLWVLYLGAKGEYILYQYDGTNVIEVARLPKGWKMHPWTESSLLNDYTITGTSAGATVALVLDRVRTVSCLCFQDGVLYISGMTPARDQSQAQYGLYPLRTALWYYASGNTGLIWESEVIYRHGFDGGGSACIPINGGLIAFADVIGQRLMVYDPNTGAVYPLADMAGQPFLGPLAVTVAATISSTATSISIAGSNNLAGILIPGSYLTDSTTGEKLLITGGLTAGYSSATTLTFTVARGYIGTTANTVATGDTVTVTQAAFPCYHLVYDWTNHVLHAIWKTQFYNSTAASTRMDTINNKHTYWQIRGKNVATQSLVYTSAFDFDSSLQKYFRSAAVDFDTNASQRTDEVAGTVDLYYQLNDAHRIPYNLGTILQINAQPNTYYPINAQGQSIAILAALNSGSTTAAKPNTPGPVLKRISVKAAPIAPGYRTRQWQLALFGRMKNKQGFPERRTAAVLRRNLEALIQSNVPINVSDSTMTAVPMVFNPEDCKIREMKPNEWVAYVSLREI